LLADEAIRSFKMMIVPRHTKMMARSWPRRMGKKDGRTRRAAPIATCFGPEFWGTLDRHWVA
jgi:hypothetical protein